MTDDRTWSTNNQDLMVSLQQRRAEPADARRSRRGSTTRAPAGTRSSRRSSGRSSRLTLQGALRFDIAQQLVPRAEDRARRGSCRRRIDFPETKGVDSYKDITPTGRRGLRRLRQRQDGGEGQPRQVSRRRRHVAAQSYANTNPTLRHAEHESARSAPPGVHADVDRRERQLPARLRSAESARPGSPRQRRRLLRRRSRICVSASRSLTSNYDPDLLNGWGVRSADWSLGALRAAADPAARVDRGRATTGARSAASR